MKLGADHGGGTRSIEAGHGAIIQLVSTGEACMERRLAIPSE